MLQFWVLKTPPHFWKLKGYRLLELVGVNKLAVTDQMWNWFKVIQFNQSYKIYAVVLAH